MWLSQWYCGNSQPVTKQDKCHQCGRCYGYTSDTDAIQAVISSAFGLMECSLKMGELESNQMLQRTASKTRRLPRIEEPVKGIPRTHQGVVGHDSSPPPAFPVRREACCPLFTQSTFHGNLVNPHQSIPGAGKCCIVFVSSLPQSRTHSVQSSTSVHCRSSLALCNSRVHATVLAMHRQNREQPKDRGADATS